MEILKRKVKSERETHKHKMTVSIANGDRLSVCWLVKDNDAHTIREDLLVNFTEDETKKIKRALE